MGPADEENLSNLLREWHVSGAPPWLDKRVLARRKRSRWPVAIAAAVLIAAGAFEAGRVFEARYQPPATADPGAANPGTKRILRVAVADYLQRSQSVLLALANADPDEPLTISGDQARAHDLIEENRLYRQTAESTGDVAVANLLDDLERVLLEIEHAPRRLSPDQLGEVRRRLREQGILFKMRVMSANVEEL